MIVHIDLNKYIYSYFQGDSGGPIFISNTLVGVNVGTAPGSLDYTHPNVVNIHVHAAFYIQYIFSLRERD
jgi:secreted trypsin-like serine protease